MELRPKTHLILDGLQDPLHGRELSARWVTAGFENGVDVAGQAAWLRVGWAPPTMSEGRVEDSKMVGGAHPTPITEADVARAAAIARAFGVELRDRAGATFRADNELPALREQMVREYRARFSQALVFGLPALALHYLGPMLTGGGGASNTSGGGGMAYPWLLEMVLVGWSLWVAGLPILWQGFASLIHLRATADLLTTMIVMLSFIPSAVGVVSLLFTSVPWFGLPYDDAGAAVELRGPAFHIAVMAVMIATFQRWQLHHHVNRLAGRGQYMLPRFGRLVLIWIVAMIATMAVAGWQIGLAFGLLLPPMLSAGGINRWSPGWSIALPVIAFAPLFLFAEAVTIAPHAASLRFEIAAGFAWMMSVVMAVGWSRWGKAATLNQPDVRS